MNLKKIFILLIIISPFFWWQFITNKNNIINEYKSAPLYIKNKITSIFTNTQYIDEFRWNDITKDNRPFWGNFFYNKCQLLISESIIYLNNLNPRFYFQSGSGQIDSPPNIEPIAFLLLPISILGLLKLINKYKIYFIIIGLSSVFFGYITGHYNFYFLLPTALYYLYCCAYEFSTWKNKNQYIFIFFLLLYSIYLFFRVILVTKL
jgi:hypothetical protein